VIAFFGCYFGADAITTILLNRPELAPYLQLAGVLTIFQTFFDAAINSFIGLDLMQYSAGTQILYSVVKSVLAPALILLGFGIRGAITGYVLGVSVAGLVGTTIMFSKFARSTNTHVQTAMCQHAVKLKELLDYSLPLYVASILSVLFTQYQNLVLAPLATNTQIGNFNAAWNFNSLLSILIYPISTAIFPMFSKMNPKNQRSDLGRGFVLAVKYTSLILIPAATGVMVLSRDLVLLTFGKGYLLAPGYLTVLATLYYFDETESSCTFHETCTSLRDKDTLSDGPRLILAEGSYRSPDAVGCFDQSACSVYLVLVLLFRVRDQISCSQGA
jgi:O-antigen/teichoic acid export membrane protein